MNEDMIGGDDVIRDDDVIHEGDAFSEPGLLLRRLTRSGVLLSALVFAFSGSPATDGALEGTLPRGSAFGTSTSWSASTEATEPAQTMPADGAALRHAIVEVNVARELLRLGELRSDAALHGYVAALDQSLTSYETGCQGHAETCVLAAELSLARSAFANQVETLGAWAAIRRVVDPDGETLVDVPDRLLGGEIIVQRIAAPSDDDIAMWLTLDSLKSA